MVQYTIVIFIESLSVFMNINKKLMYPFKLFLALLAENHQDSTLKDEKTSIIFTVTRNISASHTGSNLLKSLVCSESILLAVVLWNSAKIKPSQHNFVFPSVTSPFILGLRYKEILFSCKIMMQAIWKEVPVGLCLCIQHTTCDCLFQRRDDACDSWRLVQNIITSWSNLIRFVTSHVKNEQSVTQGTFSPPFLQYQED